MTTEPQPPTFADRRAERFDATKGSLADDLKYQLESHRVKFEGEWVLLTPDEARAILALVEAATEMQAHPSGDRFYANLEALFAALEALNV